MIKVNRQLAEFLYCILQYTYQYGNDSPSSVIKKGFNSTREAGGKYKYSYVLRNLYSSGWLDGDVDFQHMLEELAAVLMGGETFASGTVLEQIADILSSPYARNVLGGNALRDLRRIVLVPSDLPKLGESLKKEMHCATCGKPFQTGEMASLHDNGNGPGFVCTVCQVPRMAACQTGGDAPCQQAVGLKLSQIAALTDLVRTLKCSAHGGEKDPDPPKVTHDDIREMQDRLHRNHRNGVFGAAINAGPAPNMPVDDRFPAAINLVGQPLAPPPVRDDDWVVVDNAPAVPWVEDEADLGDEEED